MIYSELYFLFVKIVKINTFSDYAKRIMRELSQIFMIAHFF